jgi:ppGpp synthetase/RelA/SpoT-type nucleotidyltranferase
MKISKSLRDIHASQSELCTRLGDGVDSFMRSNKEQNWHYVSRLKDVESFTLKVESGRVKDPSHMEDFFACTLVVDNLSSMAKAEDLVRSRFEFHERRPESDTLTNKPSDSFVFDDIRLYVKWKDNPLLVPTELDGLIFEVQVKTFLAHAWSIATHDLIYKTDEKSWPKERIAFQIKAMLEHAEVSIGEAERLADCVSLKKTDRKSERISNAIRALNELWPENKALPQDKKRLAENVDNLIHNIGIDLNKLKSVLKEETRIGKGLNILNLSPYCIIIQSLLNQESGKMINYITGDSHSFKIFLPQELDLPSGLDPKKITNGILVH